MSCTFCELNKTHYWLDGKLAYVVQDKFPVTPGHSLIIPKAHRIDFFELSDEEVKEVTGLLRVCRERILSQDPSVIGFNIGMNCGEAAGQTIFHCHIHLIPRRLGDDPNPRGGVRGVIESKKSY